MNNHTFNNEPFLCGWQAVKRREKNRSLGQPFSTPSAVGAYIYDSNGNSYIDYVMGWGAIVTAHADQRIIDAVTSQMQLGSVLDNHAGIEYELAERIAAWYPRDGRIGFFVNGSDAVTAGIRIARNATQRTYVLFTGYHGWHGWAQPRRAGILVEHAKYSLPVSIDDIETVEKTVMKYKDSLACIVCEMPFRTDCAIQTIRRLRALADQFGILILFDEMKSCPRLGYKYGVDSTGVVPDMIAYGKALGGGMPFAALVVDASLDRYSNDAGLSATFWGYAPGVAAAHAILDIFDDVGTLPALKSQAATFAQHVTDIFTQYGLSVSLGPFPELPTLKGELSVAQEQAVYHSLYNGGVYVRPQHCWFLALSHTDAVNLQALPAFHDAAHAASVIRENV